MFCGENKVEVKKIKKKKFKRKKSPKQLIFMFNYQPTGGSIVQLLLRIKANKFSYSKCDDGAAGEGFLVFLVFFLFILGLSDDNGNR